MQQSHPQRVYTLRGVQRHCVWVVWRLGLAAWLACFMEAAVTRRSLTQKCMCLAVTHTHTHPFNGPLSGTTRVSRYQKGETNLDFTEARDSEWQWHQLGHLQVCTSLQTDNHTSTPPLSFLQAGCPSCRPPNSVKALQSGRHNSYRQNSPVCVVSGVVL